MIPAMRIENSSLPTRAKNVLKRLGCETLDDVVVLTPQQILRAKWAGKKVLAYITDWLNSLGLSLTIPVTTPSIGFPLLNGYLQFKSRLFEYFGYTGSDFPILDRTNQPWYVFTADCDPIWRGKDFSMVEYAGTLFIYDNAKEVKSEAAKGGE